MIDKKDYRENIVEVIKRQIKVLNSISVLILAVLFFLIIRFLSLILDYISPASIVTIISIVSGLVVIGLYIANSASKDAIKKIEEYSSKLDTLLTTTKDMREIVHFEKDCKI